MVVAAGFLLSYYFKLCITLMRCIFLPFELSKDLYIRFGKTEGYVKALSLSHHISDKLTVKVFLTLKRFF